MQAIAPEQVVALEVEDLRALPEDARRAEALRRAKRRGAGAVRSGDRTAAAGPPAASRRADALAAADAASHRDGRLVVGRAGARALGTVRRLIAAAKPSPLAELPVQYADYAAWQREFLQGTVLDAQLGYWKRALADLPELDLPADRPRPAVASHRGGRTGFEFGAELARRAAGSRAAGGGNAVHDAAGGVPGAALPVQRARRTLPSGVPIAGRTRPELEGLIGSSSTRWCCAATCPGDPASASYLAQVRERALDAYAHQDLPFEKLVEELAPSATWRAIPCSRCRSIWSTSRTRTARYRPGRRTLPRSHTSVKFDLRCASRRRAAACMRHVRIQHRPVRCRDHRAPGGALARRCWRASPPIRTWRLRACRC